MNKTPILLLAAVLVSLTACNGNGADSSARPPGASTSPAAATQPSEPATEQTTTDGELPVTDEPTSIPAGTYTLPRDAYASTAGYTVTIPDGWFVAYGHEFTSPTGPDPERVGFYAQTVDEIFTKPCNHGGRSIRVGAGVDTLVDALLEQPGPLYSTPVRTRLGGHRAIRLDVTSPKDAAQCPNIAEGFGVRLWNSGAGGNLLLHPGDTDSIYVMGFPRGRLVFVTTDNHAPASARVELEEVLDTLSFEG